MAGVVHDLADGAVDPSLINVRQGRQKFEAVAAPLLLAREVSVPFGIEVESRYCPRPIFAGGSDPRKHLTMQIELPAEVAQHLSQLDEAVCSASQAPGQWSPLVTEREGGRYLIKVRITVEGPRPATFKLGDEGQIQEATWSNLSCELDEHSGFRGSSMKVALRPAYVWSVSGRRGLSLICEQFVVTPNERAMTVDYFAN
jgi:hypothetical protein